MDWKKIDRLKSLDQFDKKNLKEDIFNELSTSFDKKVEDNEELLQFIKILSSAISEDKELFFISEEAKYIYLLTQLPNSALATPLKITKKMMLDKKLAKEWRDKINLIIHPDRSKHPLAKEAQQKLDELYKDMIRA